MFIYIRLIKPEAVSLRTLLWKNYHQKYFDLSPPKFGLNFLSNKNAEAKISCYFVVSKNLKISLLELIF